MKKPKNPIHSLYGFHAGPVVGEKFEQLVPLFDGYLWPGGHPEHFGRSFRHPSRFSGEPHRLLINSLGLTQQFAEQQIFLAKTLHDEGGETEDL